MSTQLSLIRPKTLSEMIGQEALARSIRGHFKTKRVPKAWLLHGPKGTGKTSLAYILALSMQCRHQEQFGEPCKQCRKHLKDFPILENNCADTTGVDDMRDFIGGADYELLGRGNRKVYILDEAHMLSKSSQNLLLKPLEDKSNKTVYILCSTEPQRILGTLRRRCLSYALTLLNSDNIAKLVKRLLKLAGSNLDSDELVEALIENGVSSPGLIAQAVEKYTAGNSPEKAANVEGLTDADTKALCSSIRKGDLQGAWKILASCQDSDARGLRMAVVGYLKSMMLETTEFSDRNKIVAQAIKILCSYSGAEDLVQMAALSAELYSVCRLFSEYQH